MSPLVTRPALPVPATVAGSSRLVGGEAADGFGFGSFASDFRVSGLDRCSHPHRPAEAPVMPRTGAVSSIVATILADFSLRSPAAAMRR